MMDSSGVLPSVSVVDITAPVTTTATLLSTICIHIYIHIYVYEAAYDVDGILQKSGAPTWTSSNRHF